MVKSVVKLCLYLPEFSEFARVFYLEKFYAMGPFAYAHIRAGILEG